MGERERGGEREREREREQISAELASAFFYLYHHQ